MTEPDEGFARRWSRLKRKSGDEAEGLIREPGQEPGAVPAVPAPGNDAVGDDAARGDPAVPADVVEQLPDIETLDEASDFTVFLKDGVPEDLRRRALRRLWRLNPVFANLDGLNDYDEDFTDAANVLGAVKTLYQVGKGYVQPESPEGPEAGGEASEAAAGEPEADSSKSCDPEAVALDAPQAGETGPIDATPLAEDVTPDTVEVEVSPSDAVGQRESGVSATERRWGQFKS